MKWKGSILAVIVAIAAVFLIFTRINKSIKEKIAKEEAAQQVIPSYKPPVDSFPYLYKTFREIPLADSCRIFLLDGSKASPDTKNKRLVLADGDMIFQISPEAVPFVVHTRILKLTVLKPSIFRVEAFHKDNGEKVDVLEGMVRAQKRYESQFPEADTVRSNEMVMINDQIDLMEKEKEDLSEFAKWWKTRK
ncbi:MAG TPA: hypothetical protein VM488_09490 [Pseudobacter sp.]|nr:hypothetical protein [Pseudobacter sp.]